MTEERASTRQPMERPPVGGEELYLADAVHFFLSAKRAGGRSSRTIDEYRKKLDLFQRWIVSRITPEDGDDTEGGTSGDEEPPHDAPYLYIGADDVEAYIVYLKDRGLTDTSRKGHLAVLRSFFKTVARRHKLPDPIEDLDEVRFHQRAPKRSYLTKREAEMLLSPIAAATAASTGSTLMDDINEGGDPPTGSPTDPRIARRRAVARAIAARDHAAFSAMVYAGLRIEESTALTVEDLSFGRGAEEVRVARGKGNKERIVPMSPKLRKSLRRYLGVRDELLAAGNSPVGQSPTPHLFLNEKGKRVTENTLRRRLYKWVRQSTIKKADIKPHDLRRTFGTWYLQENPGEVRELAELMGHSDLSQVMKYALSDEKRARAGITRL